jgi:hypothetical protein
VDFLISVAIETISEDRRLTAASVARRTKADSEHTRRQARQSEQSSA